MECDNCGKEFDMGYFFGVENKVYCSTCTADLDIFELAKGTKNND